VETRKQILEKTMLTSQLARIEDEYVAAGYDREAAKAYCALMEAHAAAFEHLYGVDAEQTLRAVNIERGQTGAFNASRIENGALYQFVPSVDSDAFRKWFGNSKIVDSNGKPLVVYHRTNANIEAFDMSLSSGVAGSGGYFAENTSDDHYGENVVAAYLSVQNPVDLRGGDTVIFQKQRDLLGKDMTMAFSLPQLSELSKDFREALMSAGYDGVVMDGEKPGTRYYVAFAPTQIKSANNYGAFDENDPRILYQYAGERSNMSSVVRRALATAQMLEASGKANEEIRQETGWFKGMEGRWRYEIPDNIRAIDFTPLSERPKGARILLPTIYKNPVLYEAYPFLRDIAVMDSNEEDANGSWDSQDGRGLIRINRRKGSSAHTLIHEIQHAIQDKEGFAIGGDANFQSIYPARYARMVELNKTLTTMAKAGKYGTEEYNKLNIERNAIIKESWELEISATKTYEKYLSLAGEIEARDSASRAGMTGEQRAATAPDLLSDAIVLFGEEQVAAMSIDPMAERTARVRTIQLMPAVEVKPGPPLGKKEAENIARSFGKMENKIDGRVAELPVQIVGKILRYKGYNVSTIVADIPGLYENAFLGWSEQEKGKQGHKQHNNIVNYHNYVNKFSDADGKEYYIRFTVTEMKVKPGKAGDNLIHSTSISDIIINESAETQQSASGTFPILSGRSALVDKKLQDFFNSVNPVFNSGARGSVSFMPGGRSITRIFNNSDLSTPIHEAAHVFINDLTQVVDDNGLQARLAYERELAAIPADVSAGERERLRQVVDERYRQHLRGLEQAEADMRALRENANAQRDAHGKAVGQAFEEVPLEGPLTPGQYRTLHEVNAAAFEHYILTDTPPSPKVEGLFSRMKTWLTSVYEAAKTVAGVTVTPEVREVFDRLLSATESVQDEGEDSDLRPGQ
jgi:hypothetical protein